MITCTFEDGGKAKLRHITVVCIAVNDNNEVLIEKRTSHMSRGGKWTIPGGFMDFNETTRETALRELQEETGYRGEIQYLLRINDNPQRRKEDRQNVDFIYVVTITSGELKLNKEVSEFKWITKDTVPEDTEFAFDHRDSILLYYKHLETPLSVPVIG